MVHIKHYHKQNTWSQSLFFTIIQKANEKSHIIKRFYIFYNKKSSSWLIKPLKKIKQAQRMNKTSFLTQQWWDEVYSSFLFAIQQLPNRGHAHHGHERRALAHRLRETSFVSFHTAALGKLSFYFTFFQIFLFLPIHPICPSSPRRTRRKCRRAPTASRDRRESSHRLCLNSTFFTLYDTKLTYVMILDEIYRLKD